MLRFRLMMERVNGCMHYDVWKKHHVVIFVFWLVPLV